jgi:Leucine-rich repeat (LRR) protein
LKVLPELSELTLKGNVISKIIPGSLENISRLEYLHLGNNLIENLESDAFFRMVNLKRINLEGNRLQYLHPDTFVALPKLQALYLSNDAGLQLPIYRHFIKSRSLRTLVISLCNVNSISVETFANVSTLESLDLSNNSLRSLDMNILNVMPELNLKPINISEIIPGSFENISRLE